jgi:hypothetical protein
MENQKGAVSMSDSVLALAKANAIFDICLNGSDKSSDKPGLEITKKGFQNESDTKGDRVDTKFIKLELV